MRCARCRKDVHLNAYRSEQAAVDRPLATGQRLGRVVYCIECVQAMQRKHEQTDGKTAL